MIVRQLKPVKLHNIFEKSGEIDILKRKIKYLIGLWDAQ